MRYLLWLSLIGLQKETNPVRNRRGRACKMGAINFFPFFFVLIFIFFFFLSFFLNFNKNEKDLLNLIQNANSFYGSFTLGGFLFQLGYLFFKKIAFTSTVEENCWE
jgi:hypothetical protein